jgi:hypothetical protein
VKNLNLDPINLTIARVQDIHNPDSPNLVIVPEISLTQVNVTHPGGNYTVLGDFPANVGKKVNVNDIGGLTPGVHNITLQGVNGSITTLPSTVSVDTSAFSLNGSKAMQPNGNAGTSFTAMFAGFRRAWSIPGGQFDRKITSYSAQLSTLFPFAQAHSSSLAATIGGAEINGMNSFGGAGTVSNNAGFRRFSWSGALSRYVKSGNNIQFRVTGSLNSNAWIFQPAGNNFDDLVIAIN